MNKKIGFIGAGNMAKAIINGILKSGKTTPDKICVFDIAPLNLNELSNATGVTASKSSTEVVQGSDIIFLAVKPHIIPVVLKEIAPFIKKEHVVVSIAAGVSLTQLAEHAGHHVKIIRVMPNTPSMVNTGMASLTPNSLVESADLDIVKDIFNSIGESEVVPEMQIHAVTGISGSAPAYIYMLIEALSDAGVLGGLPRDQAYKFAAQTVMGSAKMVLETGIHPAQLKDMVCSPGGTTIEAVKTLEKNGFRSAIMEAVESCMKKSQQLSQ